MLLAEASSAICVQRFDDSHTSCNSHYVSHFAAFFIVAHAKISTDRSCVIFLVWEEASERAPRGVDARCREAARTGWSAEAGCSSIRKRAFATPTEREKETTKVRKVRVKER